MTTILAPVDLSTAVKTGPRVYRKQLLRKGTIDYPTPDGKTRRVVFDDKYLTDLAAAYRDGAYDNVPFILAGADNAHTMDPTRLRGYLRSVEVTEDGVDGILELSEDAAALVDLSGGKLGVSPRIKPVQHMDGRAYPNAINHVLGTLDPRMQGPTLGLRDWEPVDLSSGDDGTVIDLTDSTYRTEGGPTMLDLSALDPEDVDALRSFAAANGIDLAAAGDDEPTPDPEPEADPEPEPEPAEDPDADADPEPDPEDSDGEGEPISDEDLMALIDGELADMGLSAPDDGTDALDLAAGLVANGADATQVAQADAAPLRGQLAARDYVAAGVPPHMVDLATPVLALSDGDADALDLSAPDGSPVNVRKVVTDLLDAAKGTIDLSGEHGHGADDDETVERETAAASWVDHVRTNS